MGRKHNTHTHWDAAGDIFSRCAFEHRGRLLLEVSPPAAADRRLKCRALVGCFFFCDTLVVVARHFCQEPMLFATTIADNIAYGREGASREEVKRHHSISEVSASHAPVH